MEAVVRKTGGEVHLVGHSFGGLVAVAVALREQVSIRSLIILEAPATELLRELNEDQHYRAFNEMTAKYFAAFAAGRTDAIASMIDFYGGAGTYASWPARVRTYAVETTPVNIMDWATASDLSVTPVSLAAIAVRTLVVCGGASHPAMQRVNVLLGRCIPGASFASIRGAAHFMIASHSGEVARLIAGQVSGGARGVNRLGRRFTR